MARASWYRLDNVGKFYSAEAGGSTQTVFRICAELADAVEPAALQTALDRTVERYPGFNVSLRSGFFWHYLEPAPNPPRIQPENIPICFGLHTGPKSVLFRVSHFNRRINLEVSHIISDGRGALGFFKRLIVEYAAVRYGTSAAMPDDETDTARSSTEDSFRKHYQRKRAGSTPTQRAYRIKGLRDTAHPTYLEYHLPAHQVLALAHRMNASVTSVVIAAVIQALRDTMPAAAAERPIRLTVPVDLRQFFESDTMRNFFGLATIVYACPDRPETLAQIAAHVQEQILAAAKPEQLERRMNQMISLERNPFLRFAPLFLKDLGIEFGQRYAARDITSAVSSLGRITFPDDVTPHLRSVNLLTTTYDLNFLVCTFGDDLSIGISTIFTNLEVVRTFCRIFTDEGIEGRININKDNAAIARDLRSTQFENTVRQLAETRQRSVRHDALR